MGEIVAAVGTCHTPYMFTRPPDEKPEELDAAAAGMAKLGKVLDETKPDVIVFLGSDHVETFSVTCIPTFAIIAGSRAVARFAGCGRSACPCRGRLQRHEVPSKTSRSASCRPCSWSPVSESHR